jgi:3-methyladenine DNA glycosylase/8-oxoguanine DNA glycosylase
MVGIAESWRPWRGVAARLLWAYYALRKQRSRRGVGGRHELLMP